VDLHWTPSITADVVGYNVYRGPDGMTWKKINVTLVASSLYSDSTVANKTTYFYSATAVDVNGKESVKTPAVKAVVP
jgi:fibronectin type 3 domain-containing protein